MCVVCKKRGLCRLALKQENLLSPRFEEPPSIIVVISALSQSFALEAEAVLADQGCLKNAPKRPKTLIGAIFKAHNCLLTFKPRISDCNTPPLTGYEEE